MPASLVAVAVLAAAVASSACGGDDGAVFGVSTGTGTTSASSAGGGSATTSSGSKSGSSSAGGATSTGAGGGATSTGVGGCQAQPWFCDRDKDTHGDLKITVEACAMPPRDPVCEGPYVVSSDDCGPNDERAYPAEPDFHGTAIKPPAYGMPYDFDCDGAITRDATQLFKGDGTLACTSQDCFSFNRPEGFAKDAECGSVKGYYECQSPLASPCAPHEKDAPQPLRCK